MLAGADSGSLLLCLLGTALPTPLKPTQDVYQERKAVTNRRPGCTQGSYRLTTIDKHTHSKSAFWGWHCLKMPANSAQQKLTVNIAGAVFKERARNNFPPLYQY